MAWFLTATLEKCCIFLKQQTRCLILLIYSLKTENEKKRCIKNVFQFKCRQNASFILLLYFRRKKHCFFTSFSKFIVEFSVGWRWNGIPFEIYWLRLYASVAVAVAMAVNSEYQQHSCCNNYIDIINFCACHKHIIIDKQFLLILIHSLTQRTVWSVCNMLPVDWRRT